MIRFKTLILENKKLAKRNILKAIQTLQKRKPEDVTDKAFWAHDVNNPHKTIARTVMAIAKHDTSPEKSRTQWMLHHYINGNYRLEDMRGVNNEISHYQETTRRLNNNLPSLNDRHKRDNPDQGVRKGEYKVSWRKLRDANDQGKPKSKYAHETFEHPEAPVIHQENDVTVHRLDSKDASTHTRECKDTSNYWCTSLRPHEEEKYGQNMYHDYYTKDKPLYVVKTKSGPYQLHFGSNQFMDSGDGPVKLPDLIQKHPELKNVEEFRNNPEHGHMFARNKQEFDDLLANNSRHVSSLHHSVFEHPYFDKETSDRLLVDPKTKHHALNVYNKHITGEQLAKVYNDAK